MLQTVRLTLKRVFIIMFLLIPALLAAGDRAEFINLGFSDDGSLFIYGQYGKDSEGSYLYADVLTHDIVQDQAVPDLSVEREYPIRQFSGQSSLNALLMALRDHAEAYNLPVNYTNTGTVLFYQLPGQDAGDIITFTDYADMTLYTLSLTIRPKVPEPGTDATISLSLFREKRDGTKNRYNAGSLLTPLEGVYEFHIKQVILSPDRSDIVIILQTRIHDESKNSDDYRYTVYSVTVNE